MAEFFFFLLSSSFWKLAKYKLIWNLDFPLKSYFLLAQLHEDYVQLTLNQVVTSPNINEKEQEFVVCQDEIIHIQNIYKSLCLNMWENLIEYEHLIQLCCNHREDNDCKILQLFSQENKTQFVSSLKTFISTNVSNLDCPTVFLCTLIFFFSDPWRKFKFQKYAKK